MIFGINNAEANADTIDLHGQHVHEAVSRLADRIQKDQGSGQTHLHVYEFHYVSHIHDDLRTSTIG